MDSEDKQFFYSRAYIYFGMAFLVTIAGFWPSYFSRLGKTSVFHHFHGISATLWMLLLVVQPLLYRMDKIEWHRMSGKVSFLLVPLIVIGGLIMVHMMLNDERYPAFLAYKLSFIDFFVIITFVMFYVLAIKNVRDTQYHARYMACTVFGPLLPALGRLFPNIGLVDNLVISLDVSYFVIEAVIILLILDDRRRGKIRLPYVLALGLMVTQHIIMHFIADWSWWQWLMDLYGSI
jgi:hypothetical protein